MAVNRPVNTVAHQPKLLAPLRSAIRKPGNPKTPAPGPLKTVRFAFPEKVMPLEDGMVDADPKYTPAKEHAITPGPQSGAQRQDSEDERILAEEEHDWDTWRTATRASLNTVNRSNTIVALLDDKRRKKLRKADEAYFKYAPKSLEDLSLSEAFRENVAWLRITSGKREGSSASAKALEGIDLSNNRAISRETEGTLKEEA